MRIVREIGLMNCILKGKTVILDFAVEDGGHKKTYHTYKTVEKAEYMWQVFGKNCHMVRESEA